jgi:nitrous oxide reductase accessory protein NosL
MKKFNPKWFIFIFLSILFLGCSEQDDSLKEGMHKVHWDRDMCERCKMVVSERKFGVQLVNPKTSKSYMFDDIGCTVLWFKEENLDWFDQSLIWINDAKTGEWINARTALYSAGNLTPMGYGLSAFSATTFPEGATKITFDEAVNVIIDFDREQKRRRLEKRKAREAARAALKNKEQ